MIKKIRIKNKKRFMYILIGVIVVVTIGIWIFIIQRNAKRDELELEKERLQKLEEESGYADAKTRPLVDYNDEILGNVEDMIRVGEQQREIEEEYPWYFDLPIENDNYIILWDWEKEKFRIALKVDEDVALSTRNTLIRNAVNDIEELTEEDIQTEDYYIMFVE
ncbi:MAG: hypothetical protein WCY37_00225 [Candidatus Dojkabacteria bacterium]|jgi:hypothetical protein